MEELTMKIIVSGTLVGKTLELLQVAGRASHEKMVLWFGQRETNGVEIRELYLPRQTTSKISIRISAKGMREILDKVRSSRLMVAAQVHSHPEGAFHSYSDDCLAIPRHEGAISLVLPDFALRTTVDTFPNDVVCFRLSQNDKWELVDVAENLEVR